jgi:putative ABC transport system permease protein
LIWRRALRDVRALRFRAVLLIVTVAAAAGTGAGCMLAKSNVRGARDDFFNHYHLAALDVRLRMPLPTAQVLKTARDVHPKRREVRLVVPGVLHTHSGPLAAELIGMRRDSTLNQLAMKSGSPLTQTRGRGVVIEGDFAKLHHAAIGDRIRVKTANGKVRLRVAGVARTPEFLLATVDPRYLVLQRGSLAVVFVPLHTLQRLLHTGPTANDLAVDVPHHRIDAARRKLEHRLPTSEAVPRDEQFSYRGTQIDLSETSAFIPVLTLVLAAVATLLIAVNTMRLVEGQRREVGALMALGYSRRSVVAGGILPAILIAAAGSVLAVPAAVGIAKLIAAQYSAAAGFPEVPWRLTPRAAELAVGLAFLTSSAAALLPALRLARLQPSVAIRGERPVTYAVPEWLRTLTGRIGMAGAYGVRSLVRQPVRAAVTALGLGGAVGLGIALHITATSVSAGSDGWFDRQAWNYTVALDHPLTDTAARRVAHRAKVRRSELSVTGSADASHAGRHKQRRVVVVGLPREPRLQRVGLPPRGLRPGTAVVSTQVARQLHLANGSRVVLDGPRGKTRLRVVGRATTIAGEDCYVRARTAQHLLGIRGRVTDLFVDASPKAAGRLRDDPSVARVVAKSSMKAGLDEEVAHLGALLDVMVSISLAVGGLFLVSSLTLSILERQGELATLRALGWRTLDVGRLVLVEGISLTAVGAVVGSLLSPLIALPLVARIGTAWFPISTNARPANFLGVVVPAVLLALVLVVHLTLRVGRIDISGAVRARALG